MPEVHTCLQKLLDLYRHIKVFLDDLSFGDYRLLNWKRFRAFG